MAKNENNDGKKQIRLVKVNADPNEKKRYDAYGYELPEEKPEPGPGAPEEVYAHENEMPAPAPRREYNADVRAAIESGAHRRPHGTEEPERPRTAVTEEPERRPQTEKGRQVAGNHRKNIADETRRTRTKEPEKEPEKEPKKEPAKEPEERQLTPAEKRAQIKKRKRRKMIAGAFKVLAVVLVVALIIILISVNTNKGTGASTQYLSKGYIEDAASGKISFLRDETPVYSSFSGIFVPDVSEGDRVAKNAVVGHVVKPEYSDALEELKDIENRISAAQKASSYIDASKSGEMLVLEDAIEKEIGKLAKLAMSGGLSGYRDSFTELNDLFERKNELEMSAGSTDTYISGLQAERQSILSRISSYMYEVHAPEAGIISFRSDGFEGRVTEITGFLRSRIEETNFTSVQSSTLTPSESAGIELPDGDLTSVAGASVNNGTTVARIATDNVYYVTMKVSDPSDHRISSGSTAVVDISGENIRFEAETVGLFYGESGAVAVFKVSRAMDSTVSLRSQEGRVIFSHIEGLKVPLRVLTDWDKAGVTARLTILRSGYIRYAYVNVLGRDNDYAIINSRSTLDDGTGISVRENEEYVVNYDKFYEGQGL